VQTIHLPLVQYTSVYSIYASVKINWFKWRKLCFFKHLQYITRYINMYQYSMMLDFTQNNCDIITVLDRIYLRPLEQHWYWIFFSISYGMTYGTEHFWCSRLHGLVMKTSWTIGLLTECEYAVRTVPTYRGGHR
jgi:hypothetical protein